MEKDPNLVDAYPPREIAHRVEQLGVAKARIDTLTLLILAILAGAFISLGALLFTFVVTKSTLGFGITRLIGGLSFSLGLILVVIAGAELFTGNNLIAMAWASKQIRTREVLRSWLLAYIGNVIGCIATVLLVYWSDVANLNDGAIAETAINIAKSKANLSFTEAFIRGILCNALVCMAVWLAIGARSVTDKVLAIIFPITAFVTMGFEHSIANWFFLPFGLLLDAHDIVSPHGAIQNLIASTLGNIVGGTLLVSGVYWIAYLRSERIDRNKTQP